MNTKTPLYKSYAMEEFLDIIFFHPLGLTIAKAAYKLKITPDQLTYASMCLGVLGGLMLAKQNIVYFGFSLLVLCSVFDSADGQLARMTKLTTLRGRILDGLIGYFMFIAAYTGLSILYLSMPSNKGIGFIISLAVVGAMMSAFQSSLYDFYRTAFYSIVTKRQVQDLNKSTDLKGFLKIAYSGYFVYQRFLAKSHLEIIKYLQEKLPQGEVPEEIAEKYKNSNIKIIRKWNFLGDNTRLLIILIAIIFHRPHWYFLAIIGLLNLLMIFLIFRQKRIDRVFLKELSDLN